MAAVPYADSDSLRQEDQLRLLRRQALEALRRLGAETPPQPSVGEEITPGIYLEDVGILLAKNRRRPQPDFISRLLQARMGRIV